jgi:hypothetical protein
LPLLPPCNCANRTDPETQRQAFRFTDGSDEAGVATWAVWRATHPREPFYPPQPGAATAAFRSQLAADLAAAAVRVPMFIHQLLRAQYVQRPFLNRALVRCAPPAFISVRRPHVLARACAPVGARVPKRPASLGSPDAPCVPPPKKTSTRPCPPLNRYAKLLLLRRHRLDLAYPLPMLDMTLMM